MKTIFVRRWHSSLAPLSSMDAEAIEELPWDAEFTARIKRRRSLPRHNFYWSVLGKIVAATDIAPSKQKLHEALLYVTGYTHFIEVREDGEWRAVRVPDSTSFGQMDEDTFGQYLEAALATLSEWTGVDVATLNREGAA